MESVSDGFSTQTYCKQKQRENITCMVKTGERTKLGTQNKYAVSILIPYVYLHEHNLLLSQIRY